MAKLITLEQAVARLEEDQGWRKYQVKYPVPLASGNFRVDEFDIPKWDVTRLRTIRDEGMDRDPGHGRFTRLVEYVPGAGLEGAPLRRTWMSDTRAEIMEHTPIFNKLFWARHSPDPLRILVNGLGLGVVIQGAIAQYGVDHVDVVEKNPDVIAMIAPLLPPGVTVHAGDAYDMTWPRGTRWDFAWHDIWPAISDGNVPEMDRLMARYKGKVHWQGCWQRRGSLIMARYMRQMEAGTLDPLTAFNLLEGRIPL